MITERHTLKHNEPHNRNPTPIPRTEATFMIYVSACRRRGKKEEKLSFPSEGQQPKEAALPGLPLKPETPLPLPWRLLSGARKNALCTLLTFLPSPREGSGNSLSGLDSGRDGRPPLQWGRGDGGESCVGESGRSYSVCVYMCASPCLNLKVK